MGSGDRKKVLFVCTHNSARSQMAEALLRHLKGHRYDAISAGTEPTILNPYAVKAMEEMGVEISHQRSKSVEEFLGEEIDLVVTVCDHAKETCPFFPGGKKQMHRSFVDPLELISQGMEPLDAFILVRDRIREWIEIVF
jgi:arsenate reductase